MTATKSVMIEYSNANTYFIHIIVPFSFLYLTVPLPVASFTEPNAIVSSPFLKPQNTHSPDEEPGMFARVRKRNGGATMFDGAGTE